MRPRLGGVATRTDCRSGCGFPARNIRDRFVCYGAMTKQTLATGILAVALLATPSLTRAGVHFSFGLRPPPWWFRPLPTFCPQPTIRTPTRPSWPMGHPDTTAARSWCGAVTGAGTGDTGSSLLRLTLDTGRPATARAHRALAASVTPAVPKGKDHEKTPAAGQPCRPTGRVPERLCGHGHGPAGRGRVRAAGRRRGAGSLRVGLVAPLRGGAQLRGRKRPRSHSGSPLLPVLWAVPRVHPKRQRQAPRLIQARALSRACTPPRPHHRDRVGPHPPNSWVRSVTTRATTPSSTSGGRSTRATAHPAGPPRDRKPAWSTSGGSGRIRG